MLAVHDRSVLPYSIWRKAYPQDTDLIPPLPPPPFRTAAAAALPYRSLHRSSSRYPRLILEGGSSLLLAILCSIHPAQLEAQLDSYPK